MLAPCSSLVRMPLNRGDSRCRTVHQQSEQGIEGGESAPASMLPLVDPIKSDSARVATAITALIFIICPWFSASSREEVS